MRHLQLIASWEEYVALVFGLLVNTREFDDNRVPTRIDSGICTYIHHIIKVFSPYLLQ